jgi:PPOX class probable F420-dependent enzyme
MAKKLADETYISLETFKRDGNGVKTPVWCAPMDGKIVIFTERGAFKVKRVGRNPRVRAAACDLLGKTRGPWSEGSCRVVDSPDVEKRAYAALHRKYGWLMRMTDFFSSLVGKIDHRAVLEVTLDP